MRKKRSAGDDKQGNLAGVYVQKGLCEKNKSGEREENKRGVYGFRDPAQGGIGEDK